MKIPSLIKLDCSTIEESDSINKEEGPFPMRDGNRETKEKKPHFPKSNISNSLNIEFLNSDIMNSQLPVKIKSST